MHKGKFLNHRHDYRCQSHICQMYGYTARPSKGANNMISETCVRRGTEQPVMVCLLSLNITIVYKESHQSRPVFVACFILRTESTSTSRRNINDLRKMQNPSVYCKESIFQFRSSLYAYGNTSSSLDRTSGIERHRSELTKLSRVQGCCRSLQSHPTSQSRHATLIDLRYSWTSVNHDHKLILML